MTRVPDHMIPDEPAVLGEIAPERRGPWDDADAAEVDADPVTATGGGPSLDIPECPDCDTYLTGNLDAETLTCDACGRVVLTETGREEQRRRRREERLRQAHNDGSFMPLSPGEWRERRDR